MTEIINRVKAIQNKEQKYKYFFQHIFTSDSINDDEIENMLKMCNIDIDDFISWTDNYTESIQNDFLQLADEELNNINMKRDELLDNYNPSLTKELDDLNFKEHITNLKKEFYINKF
jgi:arsenate reductase-like glutaredoxin family protein